MKIDTKIIKIGWGLVFVAACAVLIAMLLSSNRAQNNQRYYEQGLSFIAKKDYQNAYYNFSSVGKGNDYYCPSKYRAALAAQNLYDKESAALMYKDVINGCSGTLFEENSEYNLAKFYFEQKEFKKAKSLFSSIVKSASNEKYQTAANYFLGEIEQKNPEKAKNYFLKYLENSPDGKFAKEAIEGVIKTKSLLNSEEQYILASAMYKNGRYTEAKKLLYSVPFEKSWYYLALCARRAGDYKQAEEMLSKGLKTSTENLTEDEIHDAIDIFAMYAPDKKTGYYNAANILTVKAALGGDYALYKYIDLIQKADKAPFYHKIVNSYPQGKFASDALWNLIYLQYKRGNYAQVLKMGEEHLRRYSKTIAAPRVLFFMGKSAEKRGQFNEAKGFYRKVVEKYPDDYYAFRAKELLEGRKTAWTFKGKYHINSRSKRIAFPLQYCGLGAKDIQTLRLLMHAKDYDLLEDLLGENTIVKSWINFKQGNKALSIVQARDFISALDNKPLFSDDVYKLAYPLYYTDEINKHAQEYNLDPFVVLAIIREESHFDNSAQSYVGAGGLMQLMPDTASFISAKYNLPYNPYLRNNVDMNIALGCAYLDYALNELSKKYLFAVAGYNGGHNAVKNWHKTLNYTDFDEFVEEVPYSETQTYIRKVFRSYWNYLNIYDKIN